MASSYVNDLRLNEMATGDASGTWGDTTNTNLELIAEAFSYGTEAITTNADTHTTTIADGATDPGRSMFLKYTGTLDSTCTITIGPNTVSKLWIIENGTSGSQSIIIKQGSGATVTIPSGKTKVIYSDGAGSGGAMVDAFASLNLQTSGIIETSASIQTALIEYTDGDDAMTIADGGQVTFAQNIIGTLATAAQTNITSVGALNGGSITSGFGSIDVGSSAITTTGTVTGNTLAGTLSTAAQGNITSLGTLTTLTVDDITINGSTISDSGDLTLDVGGDITLDADGADINLKDGGTAMGRLGFENGDLNIASSQQDYDVRIKGNDGGSVITALQFDMSDAGTAIFNNNLVIPASIYHTGDTDTFFGFQSADTITFNTNGSEKMRIGTSEAVVNEGSADYDFRVESNSNSHMLFVDGGNDCVNIATGTQLQDRTLTVNGTTINTDGTNVYNQHVNIPYRGVGDGTYSGYLLLVPYKDGGSAINGGVVCGKFVASRGNSGSGNLFTTCDVNVSATYLNTGATLETQGDDDYFQELSLVTFNSVVYVALKFAQTNGGAANGITFRGWSRQTDSNFLTMKFNTEVSNISSFKGPTTRIDRTAGMIVNPNGDDVDFRVESDGNTHMLFVDGGNNRVGIGAAPTRTFEVNSGTTNVVARFESTDSRAQLEFKDSAGTAEIGNLGNHLSFLPAGSERMELNDEGGLIVTPTAGGHTVFNEGSVDADFRVESNDHEYKFFVDGGNNRIGIATSSPAADVHIKQIGDIGNGNSQGLMLESGAGSQKFILQTGRTGISNSYFNLRDVTNSRDIFSVFDTNGKFQGHTPLEWNSAAVFNENSQDHDFRVESNGNAYMLFVDGGSDAVRIGHTAAVYSGGEKLSILATGTEGVGIQTTTASKQCLGLYNSDTSGNRVYIRFAIGTGGTEVGSITSTGSATSYNTTSDARLKDVTGSARGLEVINELNPVSYNWKADSKADEGLIAQEVMEIVPNAVSGSEEEMYQMDYSKLVVHLVAGMKEQQTQIEALQSEINLLKGE